VSGSPTATRPRIGMAVYGDLSFDSRVRREARSLALAGFDVTLVCLADDGDSSDLAPNVRVVVREPPDAGALPGGPNPLRGGAGRIRKAVAAVRWLNAYVRNLRRWGRLAVEAAGPVDAWHAHDLTAMAAIAPAAPKGIPVVYDSHEIYLETGTALRLGGPGRRLLRMYEGRLVRRAAALVTVNDEVGKVLAARYRPRRLTVVHNTPERWTPPAVAPQLLRDAAGVPASAPVILHHGSLGAHRGIEELMEAILRPGLTSAHLVLLGFGEKVEDYRRAAADARWQGRLHVLAPVAPSVLLSWVASADVGAMPIQRSTLNHELSTPNKLFECIAAGTPVVASDFPGMRRVVTSWPAGPLGALCDPGSVDSIATALRSVLELDPGAVAGLRARCLAAARDRWNWETEMAGLTSLYRSLLGPA
jgi:glycosyltransferase involved in cell wall biosynthesis